MNEHIMNYCCEYIESVHSPQFAVFLKGEWGCGKTYFINKIIEKYSGANEKIQKNEIMYLSLFGIGQTAEIDTIILQKLHPILSSEVVGVASSVLWEALKSKLFILDFGGFWNNTKRK